MSDLSTVPVPAWNLIMQMSVLGLLPPTPQSYIRHTGPHGLSIFEELLSALEVPVCLKLRSNGGQSGLPKWSYIPLRFQPMPNYHRIPGNAVAIYSHRALYKRGVTSLVGRVPVAHILYEWDPQLSHTPINCLGGTVAAHVQLRGFECVTDVQDDFLALSIQLKDVDFSTLCNVQRIQSGFLANCVKLQAMRNLTPLSNVTSIGCHFMSNCGNLLSIDLSGLERVASIGSNFLRGSAISTVSLHPLSNLISVGDAFMLSNPFLHTLEPSRRKSGGLTVEEESFGLGVLPFASDALTPLSNLVSLPDNFFCNCYSLVNIDTSPLTNVTVIGDNFMSVSSKLETIHLSGLQNVTQIGHNFLAGNLNLKSVDLGPLSNLTHISDAFMMSCSMVTSLNTTPLRNVTTIGHTFLYSCSSLTSIDLSGLVNVTTIGNSFIAEAPELVDVDVSKLATLQSIGSGYFSGCPRLNVDDLMRPLHDKVVM